MNLVKEVKSSSSKWIKKNGILYKEFKWQNGYGSFSVNPSQIGTVKQYIIDQHTHHSKKTFKQEFLAFLKKYEVPFDERYLWD